VTRRWGILVAFSVTVPALLVPSPSSARPEAPAIFFVPHQDDDVLIYGADLKNHVRAGRRTIAVLLTDGSSSKLCRARYGDDRAACTDERDREFRKAMEQLGVEAVVRDDRPHDGELTEAHAAHVMQELVARFPRASLRAPSPKDPHADHAAIGRALRSMPRSPDKRFYLKPSLWAEYPDLGRWVRRRNINLALDAYAGFGRLSVPGGFAEQYGGSRTSTALTTYNQGGADAKYHR
jgi:LmbE family N-acetylglucosaminyl deacetylase